MAFPIPLDIELGVSLDSQPMLTIVSKDGATFRLCLSSEDDDGDVMGTLSVDGYIYATRKPGATLLDLIGSLGLDSSRTVLTKLEKRLVKSLGTVKLYLDGTKVLELIVLRQDLPSMGELQQALKKPRTD